MATSMRLVSITLLAIAAINGNAAAIDQVTGVVLDAWSLAPIPDAVVTLQATTVRVTAGPHGRFNLPVSGTNLVVVGAGKGYYNTSVVVDSPAASVQIRLEPVPQSDDSSYGLAPPEICGSCHPTQLDEWTGSPMSRAGLNTWVTDIYNGNGTPGGMGGFVYTRDSVHAPTNPESECASCHQPERWIDAPFSALDDELIAPSPEVMHGVLCDVCHKIADIPPSGQNFPGIYPGVVTFTRPRGPLFLPVQYGLLGDVDYASGLMRASYQPQLAAEVCGACHQDKNDPDEDGNFDQPNGVISEPTYFEWADSAYADPESPHFATCIDCHMPSNEETRVCNVISIERPAGG